MINWKDEPKYHVENIEGAMHKEVFMLGLFSGKVPFVFTVTPSHLKRISQWFKYHVELYEREYGPIKATDWQPPQPSPFHLQPPPPPHKGKGKIKDK